MNTTGGFTQVYHVLWTHYLPIIGKDALVFYLYLAYHRQTNRGHPKYGKAWPGRQKITEELSISPKQLPLLDAILESVGLVVIDHVPSGKGKPKIEYTINDPVSEDQFDESKMIEAVWKVIYSDGKLLCSAGKKINNYLSITSYQKLNNSTRKEFRDYNSRDIINYWRDKYKDVYGDAYVAKYGVEGALIKNKLLPDFGAEKLIKIIDVVFALYPQKWAKPEYPRPTIGQLATWLANTAVAFVDEPPLQMDSGGEQVAMDYETLKREGKL